MNSKPHGHRSSNNMSWTNNPQSLSCWIKAHNGFMRNACNILSNTVLNTLYYWLKWLKITKFCRYHFLFNEPTLQFCSFKLNLSNIKVCARRIALESVMPAFLMVLYLTNTALYERTKLLITITFILNHCIIETPTSKLPPLNRIPLLNNKNTNKQKLTQ